MLFRSTVVVTGAPGGVGSAAIQLCRLRNAKVIAIASESKKEALIELGASTVIDRNTVDLCDAITEAAKGPVDAALDVVGGRMLSHLLQALRQGDHYSSCGAISGPCTEIDLRLLIYKDLRLSGATIVPPPR